MTRRIQGLHEADQSTAGQVRDGLLLVRVEAPSIDGNHASPFIRFAILEPKELSEHAISRRLYRTPRALWKLT